MWLPAVHTYSSLVVSGGNVGRNFQFTFCNAHRKAAVCIEVYRLQATVALGYGFDDPGFDSWERQYRRDVVHLSLCFAEVSTDLSRTSTHVSCNCIVY